MSVVSAAGTAVPFDANAEPYPAFGSRTPGLHSFRLTYPGDDHEITLIQVLPGGISQDLSPGASGSPANIPDGRLSVLMQDANPSGEEYGYRVAHSLLNVPGARRFQIRDVGCVGRCTRPLPQQIFGSGAFPGWITFGTPLIAMVGFKLYFTGGRDRELDRIGVGFRDNNLHVELSDRNRRITFGYLVDFVVIPTGGFNVTTGVERGTATAFESTPLGQSSRMDFLLTGWSFNFQQGDHRLLDIGVVRGRNNLSVFYGDEGGGDPFSWRVDWAQIGPMVISTDLTQPAIAGVET
jgi:hypothetical protein